MDHNNTPDTWDTNCDANSAGTEHVGDVTNSFSALNVNATPFIPGQNVFAKEFVPSFKKDPSEATVESNAAAGEPADVEQSDLSTPASSEVVKKMEEDDAPDAGKSTIGGHIMYLTGQVDKRTLEKYEREAKEKNRETWYLSWALDTNLEERDKGKTVEVGRAYFETENKHFTILDAPGHRGFVPNMIGGASQADVAVLVISARKGEFETGFERGGQTREHAMLVKTAGVRHLVVVVNKMDDPTVQWSLERYDEIKDKLTPYLKKCGFNPKTDIFYLPVSGLTGINLKDHNPIICPWYNGPSLINYLDELSPVSRMADGPVRLPVVDRYKVPVVVDSVWAYDEEAMGVFPGENVKLKLKNVEEDDVSPGFVLCSPDNLCHTGKVFDAQIVILEHKSIICAGYSAVMHIHTSAQEVSIKFLICLIDKKSGAKSQTRPRFIKQDQIAIVRLQVPSGFICLETFKDFPQMGRFTLRDEGRTIAIGKILKIVS
ncbi:hypothetical protein LSH36_26g08033 [Paralvinella palmiformis]|uniref:Tr-type G domain-containing protein n=1 Tax=Paralvinella palmiformis TaxID=53620 RepID=A0AAD9KA74_9ANNE|nr:hypothetical protein LSH36_26g08033 [Paralvinella palmiformis]